MGVMIWPTVFVTVFLFVYLLSAPVWPERF